MPAERRAAGERRGAPRRKSDKKVTTGSKLDLILDVTRRLMSITDLDALLRDMAQATTQLLDADRATIFIVDREKNEIWSRVALGTGVGEIRCGDRGHGRRDGRDCQHPGCVRGSALQPRAGQAQRVSHAEP